MAWASGPIWDKEEAGEVSGKGNGWKAVFKTHFIVTFWISTKAYLYCFDGLSSHICLPCQIEYPGRLPGSWSAPAAPGSCWKCCFGMGEPGCWQSWTGLPGGPARLGAGSEPMTTGPTPAEGVKEMLLYYIEVEEQLEKRKDQNGVLWKSCSEMTFLYKCDFQNVIPIGHLQRSINVQICRINVTESL